MISPSLARRIDRLSRDAHAFHRFAHHPLCGAYTGELVGFGRRARVCKGCLYAGTGLLSGAIIGFIARPLPVWILFVALAGGALAALSLAVRLPKVLTRFAAGALGGAALVGACRLGAWGTVLGAGLTSAAGTVIAAYRVRGPDRSPCASCPERLAKQPCSGFRPIVMRERAFRRVAQRWLDAE
jgi:hypothetical protein